MPTSEDLILVVAERDLDEGLEHARTVMRQRSSRSFFERPIEAATFAAIHTLQLKSRMRGDVKLLCALARRVANGEDAQTIATGHLERILHMRELALVARTKDPEFAEIVTRARALFAARLPDLARLVAVEEAPDYPALVRKAFPDRKDVEAIVHANTQHVLWVIAHLETHPHLLRFPRAWAPKVALATREIVEWQSARVLASVARIYST